MALHGNEGLWNGKMRKKPRGRSFMEIIYEVINILDQCTAQHSQRNISLAASSQMINYSFLVNQKVNHVFSKLPIQTFSLSLYGHHYDKGNTNKIVSRRHIHESRMRDILLLVWRQRLGCAQAHWHCWTGVSVSMAPSVAHHGPILTNRPLLTPYTQHCTLDTTTSTNYAHLS